MSGADLFPYPDDTPDQISSVRSAFRSRASSLSSLATRVGTDGDMTNHGWDGQGSIGCGAEIRSNKPLLSDAGTAMGDVDAALKPYQKAVSDARTEIKKLRGRYDEAEAAHNRRLDAIDNDSSKTQSEKDIARGREADGWRYTAQGYSYEYQGHIDDVDKAAGTAGGKLDKIGTKINGSDVGGNASKIDIAAAVMEDLPFLNEELGEQFAHEAAGLVQDAANGDQEALEKLKEYSQLSENDEFATELMLEIGPDGLVGIPGTMAKRIADLVEDDEDLTSTQEDNAWLLRFLSSNLATASNPENDRHLGDGWLENLMAEGRAEHLADPENEDGAYDGYWALGQILGASDGHPPFSPHFMDTVGDDMIDWDQNEQETAETFGNGEDPADYISNKFGPYFSDLGIVGSSWITAPGTVDDGDTVPTSDPLAGLLHAAKYDPESSQMLFDNEDDLDYLVYDRRDLWLDDNVVGDPLTAATTELRNGEAGEKSAEITRNLFDTAASHDDKAEWLADGYLGDTFETVLKSYIHDVNDSLYLSDVDGDGEIDGSYEQGVFAGGETDPFAWATRFDPDALRTVMRGVFHDENVFESVTQSAVQDAHDSVMRGMYNADDYQELTSGMGANMDRAGSGLGYLLNARGHAMADDGASEDEVNTWMGRLSSLAVGNTAGQIPIVGQGISTAYGWFVAPELFPTDNENQAIAATFEHTGESATQFSDTFNQTDLNRHMYDLWKESQPEDSSGNAVTDFPDSMFDSNGNLVDREDLPAGQQAAYDAWTEDPSSSPSQTHYNNTSPSFQMRSIWGDYGNNYRRAAWDDLYND